MRYLWKKSNRYTVGLFLVPVFSIVLWGCFCASTMLFLFLCLYAIIGNQYCFFCASLWSLGWFYFHEECPWMFDRTWIGTLDHSCAIAFFMVLILIIFEHGRSFYLLVSSVFLLLFFKFFHHRRLLPWVYSFIGI